MTSEELASFHDNGYILLDNHFDLNTLDAFRDVALEVYDRWRAKELGEIYDTWAYLPEFLKIASWPATIEAVKQILDTKMLYCFLNRCRIDPPHDERKTYDWHQQTFYVMPRVRFVQTWAPLISDTTVENGTIWLAKKSHVDGPLPAYWIEETPEKARQIRVKPEVVGRYEPIQIPMKLGQLLIFDGKVIHKSGVNQSNKTRFSLIGQYVDVASGSFRAPKPSFTYRGETPREYFDSIFKMVEAL